ncbi:MAG: beta-ketoacyl synthase [Candidatus Riflebacteria bacterium]|nr:beta-ketoacyl synthase [Candidatus Riflebacteria bacterium]
MKKNKEKRIFLSGTGLITPYGEGLGKVFDGISQGQLCYGPLKEVPCETWPVRVGGWIPDIGADKLGLINNKLKNMPKYVRLGVLAAKSAFLNAGIKDNEIPPERLGAFISTGNHGRNAEGLFPAFEASIGEDKQLDLTKLGSEGIDKVHPWWLLTTISNNLIFFITHFMKAKGANSNYCNSAIAGAYAFDKALESLAIDEVDVALVGGSDSPLNWQMISDFSVLDFLAQGDLDSILPNSKILNEESKAVGSTNLTNPANLANPANTASKCPKPLYNQGAIFSDGACFAVLETEEHLMKRGVQPLCEIKAIALSRQSTDLFAPAPDGSESLEILQALTKNLTTNSRIHINTSSVGLPNWDKPEQFSIEMFSKEYNISVSGLKTWLGHTYSASFVLETAILAEALKRKVFPGFSRLKNPLEIIHWTNPIQGTFEHNYAINLGQCFGGNSAGILLHAV